MLNEIFLTALFTTLFCLLIFRLKFFGQFETGRILLVILFLSKVFAGILNAWIHWKYYDGGDSYDYFKQSGIVFEALSKHHDIKTFFQLVFAPVTHAPFAENIKPYVEAMGFFEDPGSYLLIRFNAFIRLFSFGIYGVHIVVFNFLVFVGLLYLYRFLYELKRKLKKLFLFILFLLPSSFFWLAGIHKDGVAIACIGIILFILLQVTQKKFKLKQILLLIICSYLLFITREFIFSMLIPVFVSIIIFQWSKKYSLLKIISVHVLFIAFIFSAKFISPSFNLPKKLSEQQLEFYRLIRSETVLPVTPLQPTFSGVLQNTPEALEHCLFHPTISEATSVVQFPFTIEIIFMILFCGLCLLFSKLKINAFSLSLFLSAIYMFIILGVQVTNMGALVRYKTIPMMLLLISFAFLLEKPFWRGKKKQT